MRSERWQVIEELYHSASDLPNGQRNSFLQEACGEDQSLFYEVESLIRHGSTSKSVLDTPAMAVMAKAIAADEYQSPASLLEGQTISHYRILQAIGRGGIGSGLQSRGSQTSAVCRTEGATSICGKRLPG